MTAMANSPFTEVLLIGRPNVPGVPETLDTLKQHLLDLQLTLHIETNTANCMNPAGASICDSDALPKTIQLIIVVGGDGSLLNAAHVAIQQDLPIIGVHRGRLGFLTDIHPNHLNMLDDVLRGEYQIEPRRLIQATLTQPQQTTTDLALNDVVVMHSDGPQMVEFETFIDDKFVCQQRADGLIIATPTGSTAYALSSGGPILKPKLDALTLVPMCPHTLSSRPLVVGLDCKIEVRITNNNKPVNVSCDGIQHRVADPGDHLVITPYPQKLQLVHPLAYDYFTMLREKLGWQRHAERT